MMRMNQLSQFVVALSLLLVALCGIVFLFAEDPSENTITIVDHRVNFITSAEPASGPNERIGVFVMTQREPAFLESLPASGWVPDGSQTIHFAHTLGLPHAGMWILIVDNASRVLLMLRATSLRTCPNSWAPLGEHQKEGENATTLAGRALDEELGHSFQEFVQVSTNITSEPVWYRRDYEDGRVDRQATWLWLVKLSVRGEHVQFHPDEEVAALQWVPLQELTLMAANSTFFCHSTISRLLKHSLERLSLVLDSLT